MIWTPEKIDTIPEVYRDFMTVLKPILDTRDSEAVLKFMAIPFEAVYSALANRYDYDAWQVRELADNLKRAGLVEEDRLSFFTPTPQGEELIRALAAAAPPSHRVPPLPAL